MQGPRRPNKASNARQMDFYQGKRLEIKSYGVDDLQLRKTTWNGPCASASQQAVGREEEEEKSLRPSPKGLSGGLTLTRIMMVMIMTMVMMTVVEVMTAMRSTGH